MLKTSMVLAAMVAATGALAAEAENGRRIARDHCASCHAVAPGGRSEIADAPPFDVIGRKHAFVAGALAQAISGPHARMNFSPSPRDAADIAAYIVTLDK